MSSSKPVPTNLMNSVGKPISVGRLLGRGGEGAVYEVPASDLVVKVYHEPIKQTKQEKLKAMVQGRTADLMRIATWPVDTAHDARTRTMVGFIMPKLSGYKELHTLYSPAQRKQEYPDADWSFLVHTARNAAAAVGTFHAIGHVVGDINPKNLVVAKDATVKLIDCDSFQIRSSSGQYLCEVGVPHFTPPELHDKTLSATVRTPNHDGFGLALVCFHLLFMGRHPFAGKYRNGTADMPLEKAIREFRFAYGSSAVLKQMAPPPNAPTMALVPDSIQRMFDLAFSQEGMWGKRPTTANWIQELTALQQSLIKCAVMAPHKYHSSLSQCPWCSLETRAGVPFFVYAARSSQRVTFSVDAVWATIQAVTAPGPAELPDFKYSPHPQPFVPPPGLSLQQSIDLYRQEIKLRQTAVTSTTQQLAQAQNLWNQHKADRSFEQKYNELLQRRDSCRSLLNQYQTERSQYEQRARELQLNEYLKKYLIERTKISGIGPTRAAILASYGIETAADITQSQILAIPGFGPTLAYELLKWRKMLEANFRFDASKVVRHQALIQLELRLTPKLAPFQQALESGASELEKIRRETLDRRQQLIQDLHQHSIALGQAKVNLASVEVELHSVQHQARREFISVNRKLLIRSAISSVVAVGFVAIIAFTNIGTNISRAFIDWQTTRVTATVAPPTTSPSSIPTPSITPATEIGSPSPLLTPTSDPVPTPPNSVTARTTMVSRVYEMPRPDSDMITDIPQGTEVTIVSRISSSIWCKAQLSDGRKGWLYCIFLNSDVPLDLVPIESPTIP